MFTTENTELHLWSERDRANVRLEDLEGNVLLDLWDDDVHQAVEDGFLITRGFVFGQCISPEPLHQSACDMANGQ